MRKVRYTKNVGNDNVDCYRALWGAVLESGVRLRDKAGKEGNPTKKIRRSEAGEQVEGVKYTDKPPVNK